MGRRQIMAFEIIRRKEGEMSDKQTFRHDNTQISINDWGHLVIRQFDNTHNSEEYLIVLDKETTERIISFIFSIRSTFELKNLLKDLISKNTNDDIPF
jgi:hypothetical protein